MKPITWLRKFAKRGDQGYPVATIAFYGPDDKKASKVSLGSSLRKTPNLNFINGVENCPTRIFGTISTYRTLGSRLFAGKASEASRCCRILTDVPTKRAKIIRLMKSVRLAHFGLTGDAQASHQSPACCRKSAATTIKPQSMTSCSPCENQSSWITAPNTQGQGIAQFMG
jgi:hypothetical protein